MPNLDKYITVTRMHSNHFIQFDKQLFDKTLTAATFFTTTDLTLKLVVTRMHSKPYLQF